MSAKLAQEIAEMNEALKGQGYQLDTTKGGQIKVMNEEGEFLFYAKNLRTAMEKIQEQFAAA